MACSKLKSAQYPGSSFGYSTQNVRSLPLQINIPTAEDSELHQYATQALKAAAAYADGASSPPMLNAAALTPQPARTGTAHAFSSHQPERQHSPAEQHDIQYKTSALPASQAKSLSPNVSSRANLLLSQAAAPGQSALKQTAHGLQTPGLRSKPKKHHPLYTPASVLGRTTQQKKGKPKAGDGFGIRQPVATAASAGTKVLSTKDALHHLVGPPPESKSLLNQQQPSGQQKQAGYQDRPGSIAELLGILEPMKPDDEGIEEVEAEVQDVQHLQPPDSGQQLLDTMLEGRLSPAQPRPLSQAPQHTHAPSPWTPPARALDTVENKPEGAVTPAMTLQRQFIASLQDTPAASTSRHTVGRSQAMPGTLSARLNRIVQLEKAQQTQFQATGSLGGQTMDVTIIEHRLEGHIVKCRCHKLHEADQVFAMFSNKSCFNINLSPGICVTLHAPWTELHLEGCTIPVMLCQHVSSCISQSDTGLM